MVSITLMTSWSQLSIAIHFSVMAHILKTVVSQIVAVSLISLILDQIFKFAFC